MAQQLPDQPEPQSRGYGLQEPAGSTQATRETRQVPG